MLVIVVSCYIHSVVSLLDQFFGLKPRTKHIIGTSDVDYRNSDLVHVTMV